MRCAYCQNYPISQMGYGNRVDVENLAGHMLRLEQRGAHNINLVTAGHYLPGVSQAVAGARDMGMSIPVIYNTSGYESVETIRLLDDIVQVYLADMRYASSESAERYSLTADYPERNRAAISEMFSRVGPLRIERGLAVGGLIIRHLVLPGLLDETERILRFIARELSPEIPISLMCQYFPAHRALRMPGIARRIDPEEYRRALDLLERYDLERGWIQDPDDDTGPVA
jgi:putative pyruvate formate lyase activating enzyme